jgi:two-component sensor histidine kinase
VTDALQHAFAGRLGGRVRVELGRLERQVVLAVEDNGIGLPPGAEEGDSLGFTLVRALADQIGGRLVVHRGQGTRVEITFEAGGGEDGG